MHAALGPVQGFHDRGAAEQRRLTGVLDQLRATFVGADYQLIDVPILEHLDLYLQKYGAQVLPQIYSFIDQGKRELALRPEFTPSVIRAVAGQAGDGRAARAAYAGPVFRYERPQLALGRQLTQAGVELLGDDAPFADAEVLALACQGARAAGLERMQLVLGHLGPLRELLRSLRVDGYAEQYLLEHLEYFNRGSAQRRAVRERLGLGEERDAAATDGEWPLSTSLAETVREASPEEARRQVASMLEQMGLDIGGSTRAPEEIIDRVLAKARRRAMGRDGGWRARLERALTFVEALGTLRGEPVEALARTESLLRQYDVPSGRLDELRGVLAVLRDYDLAGVDLVLAPGMARGIAYYSGLIFELFAPALRPADEGEAAVPICGGGRYDGLVRTLTGHAIPALGFAFDVERLLATLPDLPARQPASPRLAVFVGGSPQRAAGHRLAAALRREGCISRVLEGAGGQAEARARAVAEGFGAVLFQEEERPGEGNAPWQALILDRDAEGVLAAAIERTGATRAGEQRPLTAVDRPGVQP